ncbi:MAG: TolC family protein [Acidobacteriaceae bacterium]
MNQQKAGVEMSPCQTGASIGSAKPAAERSRLAALAFAALTSAALSSAVLAAFLLVACAHASAQVSLYTAVDLAMRNNNKIHSAQADVLKAQAGLDQSKDVFIPNLMFGSSVGKFYGFPVGTPTLFSFTSQSLLFNFSQKDYIRSARGELKSAELLLKQAREDVEEDTALAYMDLDRALKQQQALDEQAGYADKLVEIVQERLDAGLDDKTELTETRLSAAQIRLKQIQNEGDVETLKDHLARMTGLPAATFRTEPDSVPPQPEMPAISLQVSHVSPSVEAAFADAQAKRQTAFGDNRQLYRPEINFFANYDYFSTIYNYQNYYKGFQNNNESIGIQINLPIFDASRRAKARQSSAEAVRLESDARVGRDQAAEGNLKLQHTYRLQLAQLDVAKLQHQLAQDQLDAILLQLKSSGSRPGVPALTPRDEQNARIDERQRYIDLLTTDFSVERARLDLLKASGKLEDWVRTAASDAPGTAPGEFTGPMPIQTPAP